MNAAARDIHQSNVFYGALADMRLSRQLCMQIVLLLVVLMSALAVVYVTNMYRMSLSQLELAERQAHQLELQWGQLLLEQASLATPSRVQQLASDKLKMVLPTDHQTLVLRVR